MLVFVAVNQNTLRITAGVLSVCCKIRQNTTLSRSAGETG